MQLYWVTTAGGFEDWFVVAPTKKRAERFHECAEGFGEGDASARLVTQIAPEIEAKHNDIGEKTYWPTLELLSDLGGKIIERGNPRVVNFNGVVYIEGKSVEAFVFNELRGLCGVYVVRIQRTRKYKIGSTRDIGRRVKEFSVGNPFNLKLIYFVATQHFKDLEKLLHKCYKDCRMRGEWFLFDKKELRRVEIQLRYISLQLTDHKFYDVQFILKQADLF